MPAKKRILTGDRTTGALHLGHLFGSLLSRVQLQNEFETFIILSDYQVLYDHLHDEKRGAIQKNIREVLLDNLAAGLDPARVTFFVESEVPQISELTYLFNFFVTVARAKRNPTVKEEMASAGFLHEGHEIIDGEKVAALDEKIIAGKLIECKKIPDARKLSVARVDVGGREVSIIFGLAHEIAPGVILPVALPGAKLPGGSVETREMFGIRSEGMLCDNRELGIGEGQHFFAADTPLGAPARDFLKATKKVTEDPFNRINLGFLDFPISQAADILAARADLIPVGEDQVPHIEQTREIARDFNRIFGETFPVPEAKLAKISRLRGLDGDGKMSKSKGNTIALGASDAEITAAIKKAFSGAGTPLFDIAGAVRAELGKVPDAEKHAADLAEKHGPDGQGVRMGDFKKELTADLIELIAPIRARREKFAADPAELDRILDRGAEKMRAVAAETLAEVKQKMGIARGR